MNYFALPRFDRYFVLFSPCPGFELATLPLSDELDSTAPYIITTRKCLGNRGF